MKILLGDTLVFVVSDAETAEEIMKTHDLDFASKFNPGPDNHTIYKDCTFMNAPYGAYWRFVKKLCITKLFYGPQLVRFNEIREEERIYLLRSLVERSSKGEPCDMSEELTAMTSRIIYKMMAGRTCNSKTPEKVMEMRNCITNLLLIGNTFHFAEVFGPLKKLDLFGKGKKIKMALLDYDKLIEEVLKDHEDHRMDGYDDKDKDVIDILLEIYRDLDAEVKLTRDQIKYFFMEIFMASVDTVSTAIKRTLAQLIYHPQMINNVRKEIGSVIEESRLIMQPDIPRLPYLQAVIKESLRLNPPGPLLRRISNIDCKINGYDIKAGTRILINTYAIMRDPKRFKEPEKFFPERFMSENQRQIESKVVQDFNFIPFGAGTRACLGASLASFVVHSTLGALIQCFDWKVQDCEKLYFNHETRFGGESTFPLVCYPVARFDPFKV